MNKLLLRSFVFMTMLFVFTPLVFAAGPASVYKVQVQKVRLWNGTSWVTAFDGTSSTLDIADVSSGASAGNFLSNLVIPDGTYTKAEVTPSPTFTYSGHDGTSYTTAATGTTFGSEQGTAAQEAEYTLTLTGINIPTAKEEDFSATPITVLNGEVDHIIHVNFDVSNAITLMGAPGPEDLFPAPPVVTVTLE